MPLTSVSPTHLNVDEDTVVGLVQNFVAFRVQRKLKGDLSLSCWNFSCLGHLDITANQLDGLQHMQEIKSSLGEVENRELLLCCFIFILIILISMCD